MDPDLLEKPDTETEEVTEAPSAGIFDNVPDSFGGEIPSKPEEVEAADSAEDPDSKGDSESAPASEEKPKKTGKQFAQERREAKEKKERRLKEYPELKEKAENLEKLIAEKDAKLAELTTSREEVETEVATTTESVEVLRKQIEEANNRYIAANQNSFDPYQDEQVQQHLGAVQSALKANIPVLIPSQDGGETRVNWKTISETPERKQAIDAAIAQYASGLNTNSEGDLDKAVVLLSTALGGADIDDIDTRHKLESALSAASEHFASGMQRFQEVKENAHHIAMQERAELAKQTEESILQPLFFDEEGVSSVLEEDPNHAWASFGDMVSEIPEDHRDAVVQQLQIDAQALSQFQIKPTPLPPGSDSNAINEHSKRAAAAQARASEVLQYVAVGRAMIDGGLLPHIRSVFRDAEARLGAAAEDEVIPGGSGGESSDAPIAGGIYADVPDNFSRAS